VECQTIELDQFEAKMLAEESEAKKPQGRRISGSSPGTVAIESRLRQSADGLAIGAWLRIEAKPNYMQSPKLSVIRRKHFVDGWRIASRSFLNTGVPDFQSRPLVSA
jgi:hypothetical protein